MTNYTPDIKLGKRLDKWAIFFSVVILLVVGGMRKIKVELPFETASFPSIYSVINVIVTIVLIYAVVKIKNGDVEKHRQAIIVAMLLSVLFLGLYVLYHITSEPILYCKEGAIRYVYFIILISHILAAAVIFPFILFTFVRGFTYQVTKHKKLAKWVFPVWLYVSITGPISYIMLLPCH